MVELGFEPLVSLQPKSTLIKPLPLNHVSICDKLKSSVIKSLEGPLLPIILWAHLFLPPSPSQQSFCSSYVRALSSLFHWGETSNKKALGRQAKQRVLCRLRYRDTLPSGSSLTRILCSPNCPNLRSNLIMFLALTLTLNYIMSYCNSPTTGFVLSSPNNIVSSYLPIFSHILMPQSTAGEHRIPGIHMMSRLVDWSLICILPGGNCDNSISGLLILCPDYQGGANSKSIYSLLSGLLDLYLQLNIKLWI